MHAHYVCNVRRGRGGGVSREAERELRLARAGAWRAAEVVCDERWRSRVAAAAPRGLSHSLADSLLPRSLRRGSSLSLSARRDSAILPTSRCFCEGHDEAPSDKTASGEREGLDVPSKTSERRWTERAEQTNKHTWSTGVGAETGAGGLSRGQHTHKQTQAASTH